MKEIKCARFVDGKRLVSSCAVWVANWSHCRRLRELDGGVGQRLPATILLGTSEQIAETEDGENFNQGFLLEAKIQPFMLTCNSSAFLHV